MSAAVRRAVARPHDDRDDLRILYDLFRDEGEGFRFRTARVIADPDLAKEILSNPAGRYREHSDFFYTRSGIFGPRDAQIEVGRAVRVLLRDHLDRRAAELPGLIEAELAPLALWPDAANYLLYALFKPALLGPGTPAALTELLDQVVRRAVLAGARQRYPFPVRILFRGKVMRALTREITRRRRQATDDSDVLGVVLRSSPSDADPDQLAEVFLSCVFAVVGSIGFLVAWSVYLLGTNPAEPDTHPSHVVREALRLWPVAWWFGRSPAVEHQLGAFTVTPQDRVAVCGYLVQRNPKHWDEPDEYRPQRWAERGQHNAFLPFGWGPHACTGAAIALHAAELVIGILTTDYQLDIVQHGHRPQIAAALAPPRFTAHLTPLSDDCSPEGR